MKKVLLSLAATLILVAGFATSADAQRRGPGFYRGGGGGALSASVAAVRVAGVGFRRAGFVGGPRYWGRAASSAWRRGCVVAAGADPYAGFYGGGYRGGYYGAGYYGGGYGGGCRRWRMVATPWGPQ